MTQGQRVGVTAMSHQAIDNLMQAVVDRFTEDGDTLRAVRKGTSRSVDGVDYVDDNDRCATGEYDVIAGTPWLFANQAMRDHPVDVLVVDEAGQLGLADTLAASTSATNVVLLGDPQQLPQVTQAVHPNRSGVSALEHLLGEGVHTFPPDRGVLLDTTWRMHPDVCGFISDVMYDGKLTSEPSCETQTTSAGTGLRWLRADHTDRSTESPEEAALVAQTIRRLLGTDWTDQQGVTRPLTGSDIIVVTPYNDQRRRIRDTLHSDPLDRHDRGRHRRHIPRTRGRRRPLLHGHVVRRVHAPQRRLPLLQEPAQRRHQPRPMPRLPRLHRGTPRHHSPRRPADDPHLRTLLARRTRQQVLEVPLLVPKPRRAALPDQCSRGAASLRDVPAGLPGRLHDSGVGANEVRPQREVGRLRGEACGVDTGHGLSPFGRPPLWRTNPKLVTKLHVVKH